VEPHQTGPNETTYASRRRQWLIALSVIGSFIATFGMVFEPDPVTHTLAKPSQYLWELVPVAVLTIVMAARCFRARVVTTATSLEVFRVTSQDVLPWSDVRGFEVHRTPSGRLAPVVARVASGRTVRLALFRVDRHTGGSPEAEQLAEQLRADRQTRLTRLDRPVPTSA
jgi:hypothetical protein